MDNTVKLNSFLCMALVHHHFRSFACFPLRAFWLLAKRLASGYENDSNPKLFFVASSAGFTGS